MSYMKAATGDMNTILASMGMSPDASASGEAGSVPEVTPEAKISDERAEKLPRLQQVFGIKEGACSLSLCMCVCVCMYMYVCIYIYISI